MTPEQLPTDWRQVLAEEFQKDDFRELRAFVEQERETQTIYPRVDDVFNAFRLTPFGKTRVLLLGQDPYHGPGQAHGLSFSVPPGVRQPPSLKNMFKELANDLGCQPPSHGCLVPWAEEGVLLLNSVLTVREKKPGAHKNKGWEKFTDRVIEVVSAKTDPVVFLLWGGYARKKAPLIDRTRHHVIESAHPSPLSAHSGFFGSRPYSKTNAFLKERGVREIDWQLPEL